MLSEFPNNNATFLFFMKLARAIKNNCNKVPRFHPPMTSTIKGKVVLNWGSNCINICMSHYGRRRRCRFSHSVDYMNLFQVHMSDT